MGKNLPANAGDTGSIPEPGRSPVLWSNYWTWAPEPASGSHWSPGIRARALQQERQPLFSAPTGSPHAAVARALQQERQPLFSAPTGSPHAAVRTSKTKSKWINNFRQSSLIIRINNLQSYTMWLNHTTLSVRNQTLKSTCCPIPFIKGTKNTQSYRMPLGVRSTRGFVGMRVTS